MMKIKFGLDDFITERSQWSKHHKQLSLHVKRIYADGREIITEDKEVLALVEKYKDHLISNPIELYNMESNETINATDYFLLLNNLDYQEVDIDYYSIGSMNTKQDTHIRMIFQLGSDQFILDHSYKSAGGHAISFYDYMDMDKIEDLLEEVANKSDTLEKYGITNNIEEKCYEIILVSKDGRINDAHVERQDLLRSFIGVEIYKFDQEID